MGVFFARVMLEVIAFTAALPPTVVAAFMTVIICFGFGMDRLYAIPKKATT